MSCPYFVFEHSAGTTIDFDLDLFDSPAFFEELGKIEGLTIVGREQLFRSFGPLEADDEITTSLGKFRLSSTWEGFDTGHKVSSGNRALIDAILRQLDQSASFTRVENFVNTRQEEPEVEPPPTFTPPVEVQPPISAEAQPTSPRPEVAAKEQPPSTQLEVAAKKQPPSTQQPEPQPSSPPSPKKESDTGCGPVLVTILFAMLPVFLLGLAMEFYRDMDIDLAKARTIEGEVIHSGVSTRGTVSKRRTGFDLELKGHSKPLRFYKGDFDLLSREIQPGDLIRIYLSSSGKDIYQIEENGKVLFPKEEFEDDQPLGFIISLVCAVVAAALAVFIYRRL